MTKAVAKVGSEDLISVFLSRSLIELESPDCTFRIRA